MAACSRPRFGRREGQTSGGCDRLRGTVRTGPRSSQDRSGPLAVAALVKGPPSPVRGAGHPGGPTPAAVQRSGRIRARHLLLRRAGLRAACGFPFGLPRQQHRREAGALRGGQSERRGGEGFHGAGVRGFGCAGATSGATGRRARRIHLMRQGVGTRRLLNGVQGISPGTQCHNSILPLKLRSERAGPLPEDRATGRNPDCSGPSGTALSRACPRGRRARSRTQPWRQGHRPSSRPTTSVGVSGRSRLRR